MNMLWKSVSHPHIWSQAAMDTERETKWEGNWRTLPWKSEEHIWIVALAASCQLLSLAGGEKSNGIYTSRQKSRGRQKVFLQTQ